jgi:hypothetical protein
MAKESTAEPKASPRDAQKTGHKDNLKGSRGGRTAEQWVRATYSAGDLAGIDQHHMRVITAKLRAKWSLVDTVQVQRRSGRSWVDTGFSLVMPETRAGVSPEGGAEEVVAMARAVWEQFGGQKQVRVSALGTSQSGETSKSLFAVTVDFTDDTDDVDAPDVVAAVDNRGRREKDYESVAAMETMRTATADAMGHWNAAIGKVEKMADKVVELAEQSSKNWTGMVEIVRMQYQAQKDERDAEAQAAEDERNAARFDMFAGEAMRIGGQVLEQYLRDKVGGAAVDGTYSQRLANLLEQLSAEQKQSIERIVGDEAWQTLIDAAKGVADVAFTQLMHKAAAAMQDDPQKTIAQCLPHMPPDVGKAFVMLLHQASKG